MVNFAGLNRSSLRAFARSVAWSRGGVAQTAIRGVFDRQHLAVVLEPGAAGVSTMMTTLAVRTSEIGTLDGTERFDIDDETYQVKDARPDAEGMTVLELEIAEDES